MHDAIKNFHKQFEFKPVLANAKGLKKYPLYVIAGMGGSNLAGGLLKIWKPELNIIQHRNYGLPQLSKKTLKQSLLIASSYSGNTEETIDAFQKAVKEKIPVAVIAVDGKLLNLAKKLKKPYVQLPRTGIQPRAALGFSLMALLKIMGENSGLREAANLAHLLKTSEYERAGKILTKKLKWHVPIIYTSERNSPIGYNWKIKLNETGKIPAFHNVFPELNHNEMTGFDVNINTKDLSGKFIFLFLKDVFDNPRISKRMNVTERLLREREFAAEVVMLNGKNTLHKIFSALLIADWTAYYLAKEYNTDPTEVPMVEEFKNLIK